MEKTESLEKKVIRIIKRYRNRANRYLKHGDKGKYRDMCLILHGIAMIRQVYKK